MNDSLTPRSNHSNLVRPGIKPRLDTSVLESHNVEFSILDGDYNDGPSLQIESLVEELGEDLKQMDNKVIEMPEAFMY